jgi:hypothetical protein
MEELIELTGKTVEKVIIDEHNLYIRTICGHEININASKDYNDWCAFYSNGFESMEGKRIKEVENRQYSYRIYFGRFEYAAFRMVGFKEISGVEFSKSKKELLLHAENFYGDEIRLHYFKFGVDWHLAEFNQKVLNDYYEIANEKDIINDPKVRLLLLM